jgi:hypothetical protein
MRCLLMAVVLFLAAGAVARPTSPVSLHLDETPVSVLARMIARSAEVDVRVDARVAERRLSVRFKDVPADKALRRLAILADTTLRLEHGVYRLGEPLDPRTPLVRKRLDETKAALALEGDLLPEVLEFLGNLTGVVIVLDPGAMPLDKAPPGLTLKTSALPVSDALDLITAPLGLTWEVRWGAVMVSTPARLRILQRRVLPDSVASRVLELTFENQTVARIVGFLEEVTDLEVRWEKKALARAAKTSIDHRRNASLDLQLVELLILRGYTLRIVGHSLVVGVER